MKELHRYKILTITFRKTKLNELGGFAVPPSEDISLKEQLANLKKDFGIAEMMYLATCNRILFFISCDKNIDSDFVQSFFYSINPNLSEESISDSVLVYQGEDSIRHLYEVSSSVDSLVVGEREILRQLRASYKDSNSWKLTGDDIRLAMRFVVEVAKEIYAVTRIGEKAVSVVSLAMRQMLSANIPDRPRILLVGAGQTNILVSKFLIKSEFENVTVFNRTLSKAQSLANSLKGDALTLDALKTYKEGFDILIVCTGSVQPLINEYVYKQLIQDDLSQKVLIDLAVPNNVSKKVPEVFNVEYIEVEGLRKLAQKNLQFRGKEVIKAKVLLEKRIIEFGHNYKERMVERAFREVPVQVKAVKKRALEEVFKKEMDSLDDPTKELVGRMMDYMEKKCISIPIKTAKKAVLPSNLVPCLCK